MKVLVTGGAGFIGSKVVADLVSSGHSATVFDDLSTGHADLVPEGVQIIHGQIEDASAIRNALAGHDAVIHFVAKSIVPKSVADPQAAFDTNLVGGQNLLEAMRNNGINRIVYSSTAAVYGTPTKVPILEDDPKFPINPYGAYKYSFEHILHAYHSCYGIHAVMFRYFNPYGPGENHDPETHAIPNFIKATLSNQPIPLYWKGEQKRDFFYVEDIAKAHTLGLSKDGFNYYNLGSGQASKVIDIVNLIFKLTGKSTAIQDLGERIGDPPELLADVSKVKRELGWGPTTSLHEGLSKTIAYFQDRQA